MSVMRELMYQYRIVNSVANKDKKNEHLNRLKKEHQLIFHLPKEIKNAGMRKFDSMYAEFAKWMKRKNDDLE